MQWWLLSTCYNTHMWTPYFHFFNLLIISLTASCIKKKEESFHIIGCWEQVWLPAVFYWICFSYSRFLQIRRCTVLLVRVHHWNLLNLRQQRCWILKSEWVFFLLLIFYHNTALYNNRLNLTLLSIHYCFYSNDLYVGHATQRKANNKWIF